MRKFDLYSNSKTVQLNGLWDFVLDKEDVGEKEDWFKHELKDAVTMAVPSCWNTDSDFFDYEGIAWYQKKFAHSGGNIKILFEAVANEAKVYLDGEYLGSHYGGFTAFSFQKYDLKSGLHRLTVRVENTHNSLNTLPLSKVDWYHYGGIIRNVEVTDIGESFIRTFTVDYKLDEKLENAAVTLHIDSHGAGQYDFLVNGEKLQTVTIADGISTIGIDLNSVLLWSMENPILYIFTLKSDQGEYSQRTGFRKIEAKNNKIYLNGKSICIRGINRHEQHPDWGFSVPEGISLRDMQLIRKMGCNMIRGSHYPNSQQFLDLCDEQGILFWSEIPLWQYQDEQMKNPLLVQRAACMMEEMVQQYFNHPSIILWGLHNECSTDTQVGKNFTKMLYDIVKKLDQTRLITYASDKIERDICLDYCDVIAINKYIGWYEGKMEDWDAFMDMAETNIHKKLAQGTPVLISEFGAAAVFGVQEMEPYKWSEQYQSLYLEKAVETFQKRFYIAGMCIWQFSDIRVCNEHVLSRARGFNNKGILNEYRKPKLSYYTVQRLYHNF